MEEPRPIKSLQSLKSSPPQLRLLEHSPVLLQALLKLQPSNNVAAAAVGVALVVEAKTTAETAVAAEEVAIITKTTSHLLIILQITKISRTRLKSLTKEAKGPALTSPTTRAAVTGPKAVMRPTVPTLLSAAGSTSLLHVLLLQIDMLASLEYLKNTVYFTTPSTTDLLANLTCQT